MLAETTTMETPHVTDSAHKMKFFRQSGWMMIATVISGVFMSIVHICSKKLSSEEYSAFASLIQLINQMTIPALGLQMIFAQQSSAAISDTRKHQLVGTMRAVMWGTFYIWLVMAALSVLDRGNLISDFKLSNPASLWLTVGVALMMLWLPIFQGLLQGRQNFLWLGWVAIFNGVGRVVIGVGIVFLLSPNAIGIMTGVLLGLVGAVGTAMWQNRDLFSQTSAPFDWRSWLKLVIPFTIGAGAFQFIFSEDAIIVQKYLGANGAAAGSILQALSPGHCCLHGAAGYRHVSKTGGKCRPFAQALVQFAGDDAAGHSGPRGSGRDCPADRFAAGHKLGPRRNMPQQSNR